MPTHYPPGPGILGNDLSLNTMGFDSSGHSRPSSSINILKLGLIFAGNAIATRIILRIQSLRRTSIAVSAWIWQNSFPAIAMICGALRLQIRSKVIQFGVVLHRQDPSTERLFHAQLGDRFRSSPKQPCASFETLKIGTGKRPGATTGSWMLSTR